MAGYAGGLLGMHLLNLREGLGIHLLNSREGCGTFGCSNCTWAYLTGWGIICGLAPARFCLITEKGLSEDWGPVLPNGSFLRT